MMKTWEHAVVWGSLGAGVALITSGHKYWGFAVASAAPATMSITHPKQTRRVLNTIWKGMEASGKAVGSSTAFGSKATWQTAKAVGKGWKTAGKAASRAWA
jgi:hypothetical protein